MALVNRRLQSAADFQSTLKVWQNLGKLRTSERRKSPLMMIDRVIVACKRLNAGFRAQKMIRHYSTKIVEKILRVDCRDRKDLVLLLLSSHHGTSEKISSLSRCHQQPLQIAYCRAVRVQNSIPFLWSPLIPDFGVSFQTAWTC